MQKILFGVLVVALLQLSLVSAISFDTSKEEAMDIAMAAYPHRGEVEAVHFELGLWKGRTTPAWKITLLSDDEVKVTHVIIRAETGDILRVNTEFNRGQYSR